MQKTFFLWHLECQFDQQNVFLKEVFRTRAFAYFDLVTCKRNTFGQRLLFELNRISGYYNHVLLMISI